jgi:hypothetical protein
LKEVASGSSSLANEKVSSQGSKGNGNGNDHGNDSPGGKPPQSVADLAAMIAAATARLGGDAARQGRSIAADFLKDKSAMRAEVALLKVARKAGIERAALGVPFTLIFSATRGDA